MKQLLTQLIRRPVLILAAMACLSCAKSDPGPAPSGAGQEAKPTTARGSDANVTTRGSIEVTAKLLEIPEGAIFKRDLYDYAAVLKYQVLEVHRGKLDGETIYVGHYNPFKPRSEAADQRVKEIGGDLKAFRAGQVHRMALEVPIDDHFMGGRVDKYFDQNPGPIYWAVWTNLVSD
jgi:hypothetical protein